MVSKLGDYTIINKVSNTVDRVRDANGKEWAAKSFCASGKRTYSTEDISEFKILQEVNHDNILKVDNSFLLDDGRKAVMIMEWCDQDLLSRMEDTTEPLGLDEKLEIMRQLDMGVNHLHNNAKIVHRDLKP